MKYPARPYVLAKMANIAVTNVENISEATSLFTSVHLNIKDNAGGVCIIVSIKCIATPIRAPNGT